MGESPHRIRQDRSKAREGLNRAGTSGDPPGPASVQHLDPIFQRGSRVSINESWYSPRSIANLVQPLRYGIPLMTIRTKADYRHYLAEDMRACDPALVSWRPWHAIKYPTLAWLRKLRRAELMINRAKGPPSRIIALYFRHRARSAGIRLGFSIPPNVFGPGLCIVHWGTIVVNDKARVGARCRLHPCTVIGAKETGVPHLGDDCYIGPGAKLIGGITLGDRVRVGANAVVSKSFPADSILAGVPARALRPDGQTDAHDEAV